VTCRSCWFGSMRPKTLEIVRELVRAHEYWRMKRFDVDLVILNERPPSYDQDLQTALEALVRANRARPHSDGEGARGTVFVLRADLVSVEVRRLLQTVARAVLLSRRGTPPSRSNVWM